MCHENGRDEYNMWKFDAERPTLSLAIRVHVISACACVRNLVMCDIVDLILRDTVCCHPRSQSVST